MRLTPASSTDRAFPPGTDRDWSPFAADDLVTAPISSDPRSIDVVSTSTIVWMGDVSLPLDEEMARQPGQSRCVYQPKSRSESRETRAALPKATPATAFRAQGANC